MVGARGGARGRLPAGLDPVQLSSSRGSDGVDVRTVGSGNVGATNVMRSVGKGAGGWPSSSISRRASAATWLAREDGRRRRASRAWPRWWPCSATCTRSGSASAAARAWPPARARSFPSLPLPTMGALAHRSRVVAAGHALRVARLDRGQRHRWARWRFLFGALPPVPWAATAVAVLIVWKHRENIRRLAAGTERRMGAPRGAEHLRIAVVGRGLVGHRARRAPGRAPATTCACGRGAPEAAAEIAAGRNERLPPRRHAPAARRDHRPRGRRSRGAETVLVAVPSEFCRRPIARSRPALARGRGRRLRHQGTRARHAARG